MMCIWGYATDVNEGGHINNYVLFYHEATEPLTSAMLVRGSVEYMILNKAVASSFSFSSSSMRMHRLQVQ